MISPCLMLESVEKKDKNMTTLWFVILYLLLIQVPCYWPIKWVSEIMWPSLLWPNWVRREILKLSLTFKEVCFSQLTGKYKKPKTSTNLFHLAILTSLLTIAMHHYMYIYIYPTYTGIRCSHTLYTHSLRVFPFVNLYTAWLCFSSFLFWFCFVLFLRVQTSKICSQSIKKCCPCFHSMLLLFFVSSDAQASFWWCFFACFMSMAVVQWGHRWTYSVFSFNYW